MTQVKKKMKWIWIYKFTLILTPLCDSKEGQNENIFPITYRSLQKQLASNLRWSTPNKEHFFLNRSILKVFQESHNNLTKSPIWCLHSKLGDFVAFLENLNCISRICLLMLWFQILKLNPLFLTKSLFV